MPLLLSFYFSQEERQPRSNGLSYFLLAPSKGKKRDPGNVENSQSSRNETKRTVLHLFLAIFNCFFFPLRSFESDRLFFGIAVSSRP